MHLDGMSAEDEGASQSASGGTETAVTHPADKPDTEERVHERELQTDRGSDVDFLYIKNAIQKEKGDKRFKNQKQSMSRRPQVIRCCLIAPKGFQSNTQKASSIPSIFITYLTCHRKEPTKSPF